MFARDFNRTADCDVAALGEHLLGEKKHDLVVAEDAGIACVHDTLHASGGFGAVTHDVAEANDSAHGIARHIGIDRSQGVDVPMDVADEGDRFFF